MPAPHKEATVMVTKPFPFAKKTTLFYTGGVKKKPPRDPFCVQHKKSSAGYDGGVTRKRTKSKKK